MKDTSILWNPFRMLSPKLDHETVRLDELHAKKVTESVSVEEGLLITLSKVIEMTRLISKCIFSGSAAQMEACMALGDEVDTQERRLTTDLVCAGIPIGMPKTLLRFPFRLERMGDMLERILECARVKARDGIPFSDLAQADLDQLFVTILILLNDLRDALRSCNKPLIQSILTESKKYRDMLYDARLGHWDRLERGYCAVQAGPLYLEILDSLGHINEYVEKMGQTLLESCDAR